MDQERAGYAKDPSVVPKTFTRYANILTLDPKPNGYADPNSVTAKRDFFKRLGIQYNYGENKKLNLNIKSIFDKITKTNQVKGEHLQIDQRAKTSASMRPNSEQSETKVIIIHKQIWNVINFPF